MTLASLEQKAGPVGRNSGPLATFIKGRRNGSDTKLFQQCGEVTPESKRPFSSTSSGRAKHRSTGQRYCPQRRDRRSKHPKVVSPNDTKRKHTTKSKRSHRARPDHGCHDTTSNAIITTGARTHPTLICVRCGGEVTYTNENRCEDCFADDQQLWHGRDLSVNLHKATEEDD